MKRKLLFSFFVLFTVFYSNAQVIDIMGLGVHGKVSATLELTNIDNIDHVDAVAVSKGLYETPPPDGVLFDNNNNNDQASTWSAVVEHNSTDNDISVGYYSRSFNILTDKDINATINIKDYIHSFYVYVYRDIPDAQYISFSNLKTSFIFHNGSSDPVEYDIPINTAPSARDILVKIPITELDDTERMMVIDIEAGSVSKQIIETTWGADMNNSFLLGEYVLENVPGDITNVTVSIYSPNPNIGEADGDSFIVGGVIVNVDKVYDGCTLTQGYWKNHSECPRNGKGPERDDTWDLVGDNAEFTTFFNSNQNYCQVFDTNSGKGGKYYILAHQYMAAELNILNNADPTSITETFNKATDFLTMYSPSDVDGVKGLEDQCVALGEILDRYNNGRIGPGHCDDVNTISNLLNVDEENSVERNVEIYPNPVTMFGRIHFTPVQSAETTIEVFNILGQKVSVLYNEYTMGGVPVSVDYDTKHMNRGIHFIHIRNGSSTVTKKLSISK